MKAFLIILLYFVLNNADSKSLVKPCLIYGGNTNNCKEELLSYIKNSTKSIKVSSNLFESLEIASSIIKRQISLVDISVIVDKKTLESKAGKDVIDLFNENLLNICIAYGHKNASFDNNFIIFDNKILQTGSINYIDSQFNNYQNILYINDTDIVQKYTNYFDCVANSCEPISVY